MLLYGAVGAALLGGTLWYLSRDEDEEGGPAPAPAPPPTPKTIVKKVVDELTPGTQAARIYAAYKGRSGMSPALAKRIVDVAHAVGAHPFDLANLINWESGRTFRSDIQNKEGDPPSLATGLIQFTPSTAKKLGTTVDALAKLTPVQQMSWVRKYLMRVKAGQWDDKTPGPLNSPQRLAMAVFYPWAREWDPNASFAAKGHGRVLEWNPGITSPAAYLNKMARAAKLSFGSTIPEIAEPKLSGFGARPAHYRYLVRRTA